MSSKEEEPLTEKERRYQKRRHRIIDYTKEKEDKGKTPLSGGMKGKELSRLLLQTMYELRNEINGMRKGRHKYCSISLSHEGSRSSSYYVRKNSAAQSYMQCYTMPRFTARKMDKEDAPKEETLSDYLQEYESQSWRFKEHMDFQGFFKLKEERRCRNHNRIKRGRIFLSNFDGSTKCTTKAWVEELDSYF